MFQQKVSCDGACMCGGYVTIMSNYNVRYNLIISNIVPAHVEDIVQ